MSATEGDDGSEETGDGAEDRDSPSASTCAAYSTALDATAHARLPRGCIVCNDREHRGLCHLNMSFRWPHFARVVSEGESGMRVTSHHVYSQKAESPRADREVAA